jgi:hypothetical protein
VSTKADFNAAEWELIRQAPPTAGLIVIIADRGGAIRESYSMAKVYVETQKDRGHSDLLEQLVEEKPEFDRDRFKNPEEVRTGGLQLIRDALATLESKASKEEVEDYKRFIITIADTVAHAAKEGGVLGFGGKEVSEAERAAVEEIAQAAGTDPPPADADE